jgi:IS30 family transposase
MTAYSHLASEERDRIALMRSQGFGCRLIARQLNRSASTISREVRRNALAGGAYRPSIADGGYLLRRQRAAILEMDAKLAAYVTDRLAEGWTPEQIAGRRRRG